jgi:hypothetical protein
MVKIIQRNTAQKEIEQYVMLIMHVASLVGIHCDIIEKKRTSFLLFKEVYLYIVIEGDENTLLEFETLI